MFANAKALSLLALCLLTHAVHSCPTAPETLLKRGEDPLPTGDWKEIRDIAQARRQKALDDFFPVPAVDDDDLPMDLRSYPKTSGLLSKKELRIIDTEAEDLLRQIKYRRLSSHEVTKAFSRAAVIAQNMTNCVTEVLFEEGLKRAKYLDKYLAKTGRVIGPLHGLPISLKDSYLTPPYPSSIGMAIHGNVTTAEEPHTVIVDMLREMGAVFYVKTNVPTAMMSGETINNIWGETRNPVHKVSTPGGSTGGEGALLAMKASPLGVGTDIGGSIRIPAGYCHLYGLKPSFGRFPTWGVRPAIAGQDIISSVSGPMSRSLGSVKLFAKTLLSEEAAPWTRDPKMVPIPWRSNVIQPRGRKLRFAFMPCADGLITCHPPVERALKMVKKILKRHGHEVIDWVPETTAELEALPGQAFTQTGGDKLFAQLKAFNEPLLGTLKVMFPGNQPPNATLGPETLRSMILSRNQLQKDWLKQWMSTKTKHGVIDGMISPLAVAPAQRLQMNPILTYAGFTGFGNALDLPSCTFPVTYADKKLDPERGSDWKPIGERDKMVQGDYDAKFYHGAPVSLQVLGKRLEEEKVLEMAEVVSKLINFKHRA